MHHAFILFMVDEPGTEPVQADVYPVDISVRRQERLDRCRRRHQVGRVERAGRQERAQQTGRAGSVGRDSERASLRRADHKVVVPLLCVGEDQVGVDAERERDAARQVVGVRGDAEDDQGQDFKLMYLSQALVQDVTLPAAGS